MMNSTPFVVYSLLEYSSSARTLVDNGNLTYGVIDERFARKHKLPMFDISPKPVRGVTGTVEYITKVVRTRMDIETHSEDRAYFYVLPNCLGYDLILGQPWLVRHDARLEPKRGKLYLRSTGARL